MSWISYNTQLIAEESKNAFSSCINMQGCENCPCEDECENIGCARTLLRHIIRKNSIGESPRSKYRENLDFVSITKYIDDIDYNLKKQCNNCENCPNIELCGFVDDISIKIYNYLKKMNETFRAQPWV